MRFWLALVAGLSVSATNASAYSSIDFSNIESGSRQTSRVDGVSIFTEEVQAGTYPIDGVQTKRILTLDGVNAGASDFVTNDALGLRLHRINYPPPESDVFRFTTPLVGLPGTFTVSQTFGQDDGGVSYVVPGFGTFPLLFDYSGQVIGIEVVVVPAGTFTAIRVDSDLTIFGTIDGEPVSTGGPGSDWFVRNLGAVKSSGVTDGEPYLVELMSHNIGLCGDLTLDGVIAASDVAVYRSALAGSTTLNGTQLARCATVAPVSPCNVRDLAVLRREVSGPLLEPGISRACKPP